MSVKKTIAKWSILVVLVAYLVAVLVYAHRSAAGLQCVGIEVIDMGQGRPIDDDMRRGIVEELGRYSPNLLKTPVERINTHALERRLSKLSNFESVECTVTPTGKLRIYVVPVIPEVRVFDGSRSYYLNKDGKQVAADARFYEDVPLVSGHFTESFPAKSLLPVVRHVQGNELLRNLVTMVSASDPDNILLVPSIRGHIINIGDTTDLDTKFRNLVAMYRQVIPYKGWNTYDTISVKFRGQIVATRADKGPQVHAEQFEELEDPEEGTLPEEYTSPLGD